MHLRQKATQLLAVILVSALQGCAVREQAFDCIHVTDKDRSDELIITPTLMKFQSQRYQFREEQGATRVYEKADKTTQVSFNVASGLLQTATEQWRCKKYTLSVEKG